MNGFAKSVGVKEPGAEARLPKEEEPRNDREAKEEEKENE